jgi:hypothetical protein
MHLNTYFTNSGASEGNRTPDPQLRRLLLYPTELLTHILYTKHIIYENKNQRVIN